MWDGLLLLILLCIVMAASSFLVGMLPLYFSLSSRQLRLISALGTGVLVGVALIIIIPEGVETLYNANGASSDIAARSLSVPRAALNSEPLFHSWHVNAFSRRDEITALPADTGFADTSKPHVDFDVEEATEAQELDMEQRQRQKQEEDKQKAQPGTPQDDDSTSSHSRDPHTWVGLSLISGFILMYLIDTIPRNAPPRPERSLVSLNNLNFNNRSPSTPRDSESIDQQTLPAAAQPSSSTRPSSTTTGLVIHACADGIALGASSTTTSSLTFIIFLAIIVHKAPASFGLTSVLLKQGLSKRTARTHLMIFSLAAPVGALVTWAAAHLLSYSSSSQGEMSTEFATGVLLMFSGGTFLYVATHTMQDPGHGEGGGGGHVGNGEVPMNGYRGVSMSDVYETSNAGVPKGGGKKARLSETGLTVLGMLLPLLFQFGHAH